MAIDATVSGLVSNSYVTLAQADTYFEDRNNATWSAASEADRDAGLLYAARVIDLFDDLVGDEVVTTNQAMWFPQITAKGTISKKVYDGIVPDLVKETQYELALDHLNNPINAVVSLGGGIKTASLTGLSVTFRETTIGRRVMKYARRLLTDVRTGSSIYSMKLARA